jgi:hypothetical protein
MPKKLTVLAPKVKLLCISTYSKIDLLTCRSVTVWHRTVVLPASDGRAAEDAPIYLAGEDTIGEDWFERTTVI